MKNERGNTVERRFHRYRDRNAYEQRYCPVSEGWIQYSTTQDAPFFGVWVNRASRIIISFAQGDETAITCPTEASYAAELAAMAKFYGPLPQAFTMVADDGTVKRRYTERPTK